MPLPTLLLTDDAMVEHRTGAGHPERPDRLVAVTTLLKDRPVPGTRWRAPAPAEVESVRRVHGERHIARLESLRGRSGYLDADTSVSPGSLAAAYLAAGATIEAVDAVLDGAAANAFALVRPPGHHAERESAMGFCLFNNVAVAAAHALARPDVERILIVDWDVHHGNGTQHAFADRADVLFFSIHRHPFYPGTGPLDFVGLGDGEGSCVNVPLDVPLGDADYGAAFEELLAPMAESFDPDLVLVSAGFDAHRDDPLGGMRVTEDGFATLCGAVRGIAERHCGGRLVLVLEGGYDLAGLSRSVRACVEVLAGGGSPAVVPGASPAGSRILEAVAARHRRYGLL